MNTEKVAQIFETLSQKFPNPETELVYTNVFTLLIAVVLSAQSTDKGVNKATQKLFEIVKTPNDILNLGKDELISFIKTIGLYQTKAKNIMKLCEILVNDYNGEVPNTREALESLPGVGRKTANVILNIAFNELTLAVDTHIFRLSNRLGLSNGKTPFEVEKQLLKIIPTSYLKYAHHWLILHGRYVCKARKPLCDECAIKHQCDTFQKNQESGTTSTPL